MNTVDEQSGDEEAVGNVEEESYGEEEISNYYEVLDAVGIRVELE